ncbi:MAG: hypothetical protein L6R37_006124 [Teloschistes peruensis]|nr:MAG: hypothetical protein L6R37_006124 [Teloschistes peruensis]
MVSTWTFRDFQGLIPLGACQGVWKLVEQLAANRISKGKGDSSVTLWPLMWKETIKFSWEDHGQWFDVTILASWRLTWRMLDEALEVRSSLDGPQGAYLVCQSEKEFRFEVVAARKVVATGSVSRRMRDSSTEKRTPKLISSRDQEIKAAINATEASSSTNITMGPPVRDPYIWHRPDMISTWEFHSFRGRVDTMTAQQTWLAILTLARSKVLRGKGSFSIKKPFSPKPLVFSWRDFRTRREVETTICPTSAFTYLALMESSTEHEYGPSGLMGAALACERRQEFDFNVWIGREHVGGGTTRTRYPDTAAS